VCACARARARARVKRVYVERKREIKDVPGHTRASAIVEM